MVRPNSIFTAFAEHPTSGLVGTLGVRIVDGEGTVVVPRTTDGIVEVVPGSGLYSKQLTAPAALGKYLVVWDTGADGPGTSTAEEIEVAYTQPTPGDAPGTDLLTLAEYKSLLGIQATDERNDGQISALIPAVSRTVRNFTGRNFEVASGPATPREYQYDESDMLDIDDCVAVVSVSTDAGVPTQSYDLHSEEWTAMPQDDSDVFYYVLIHGGPYYGGSPEMGFKRNLDTLPYSPKRPLITVTAQWGWPAIPQDVKLSAALTAQSFLSGGASGRGSEDLTSEAIEGFARSWGGRSGESVAMAVPNKARDILAGYQRIFV